MNDVLNESRDETVIDLRKLLLAYLHRWWLIVLCTVLVAAAALVYTYYFVTPLYQAKISVIVNNNSGTKTTDTVTTSEISASQQLVKTYITIITSNRVVGEVQELLGSDYTVEQLKKMISAEQLNSTELFTLAVTSPSPTEAARVANAFADVGPAVISELIEGSSAKVLDHAEVPEKRYSPSYKKNVAIGALLGLVLSAGYLTIAFLMDTRIKDEADLTEISAYPILGQIPDFSSLSGKNSKAYKAYSYESTGRARKGEESK